MEINETALVSTTSVVNPSHQNVITDNVTFRQLMPPISRILYTFEVLK